MARGLRWGAGIVAGLALAVVAAVLLVDWSRAGDWAAGRLSEATGRQIVVADVAIDWAWSPRIIASGIDVANAPWGSDPLMARIERLEAVVRLPALLRGRLELPEIVAVRPRLLLEKNPDGIGNWSFTTPGTEAAADAATPDERDDFPVIGRLAVQEGVVTFRDPAKDVDLTSQVNTVAGRGGSGEGDVRLVGEGRLEGRPLRLELGAGPILMLRDSDAPYPLRLDLRAGGTRVVMDGTMREPVKMQGADLTLSLAGPDLAEIFPLFGIPTPSTAPYALEGRVRRDEGLWRVEDLRGKVGRSDLSGWITLEQREVRPLIRGELTSRRLALADLGGLVGLSPGDRPDREAPAAEARVIPDTPVNLARLRAADMDIAFRGGDVVVPVVPLREVAFRLRLKDGNAVLDPLRFTAEIGAVAGAVTLDGSGKVPAAAFDIAVSGVGLRPFFAGTRFEEETAGRINGRVKLRGRGDSLSAILARADGQVGMVMDGGRVSALLIEAAGIDVAEALGDLLGGDEPVVVRCAVADLPVKNGVMASRAFVFDTEDSVIGGDVGIDWKREGLDVRLVVEPKDASLLAARVPVTVGGTLAAPEIGVESGELAARGAAAVALGALATPLAAILPFIDVGEGEDAPCGALIERTERNARRQPPG